MTVHPSSTPSYSYTQSITTQGDLRTMKIYTISQRIDSSIDAALYLHAFGDSAWTSNAKATTAKRAIEEDNGIDLVSYSYKVDTESIEAGTKVYTIQQVHTLADGSKVYSNFGPDTGYLKASKATKALRDLREASPDVRLVLYSFKVDEPELREWPVTLRVSIMAHTEAEAIAIAGRCYNGLD